jgi:hypothetical protein
MAFLKDMVRDTVAVDTDIREGRFQRALSLVAALSGLLAGLEVAYEHYRGSYGQKVMYTPVILSPLLMIAGIAGVFSKRATKTILPIASWLNLIDGVIGFGFHIRGIARKPGGWRLPVANIIMGPPILAPLLFGIGGYLGVIATYLRRTDAPAGPEVHPTLRPLRAWLEVSAAPAHNSEEDNPPAPNSGGDGQDQGSKGASWEQDIREGRFQKHLAVAAAAASVFSGFESLYSHYKINFRYKVQWSPIIVSAALTVTALISVFNRKVAKTLLPAMSLLAMLDGAAGFVYHAIGIVRRPGGLKKPLYNIMYGPPILAPLLFAASGALGLLASLMRREK